MRDAQLLTTVLSDRHLKHTPFPTSFSGRDKWFWQTV